MPLADAGRDEKPGTGLAKEDGPRLTDDELPKVPRFAVELDPLRLARVGSCEWLTLDKSYMLEAAKLCVSWL